MIDHGPLDGGMLRIADGASAGMRQTDVMAMHASGLDLIATLAIRRGNTPAAERLRLEAVRELLAAASEVNRSLAVFLRHALVHCQGTPGCSDLEADRRVVAAALRQFSARCARSSMEERVQSEGRPLTGSERTTPPGSESERPARMPHRAAQPNVDVR